MSDKNQGGRPKSDIEKKIVPVALPVELYAKLAAKCKESGTPLATYIRQLVAKDVN